MPVALYPPAPATRVRAGTALSSDLQGVAIFSLLGLLIALVGILTGPSVDLGTIALL